MPGPQSNHTQITAAFKQQFHDSFELACQQKKSVLESAVTNRGAIQGSSFTINDLGTVEMNDRMATAGGGNGRFQPTNLVVPDAGTRVAIMNDFDLYIPIEPFDLPKLSAAPDNAYMQLMVAAANRAKDQLIFKALLGSIGRRTADNVTGGTALTPRPLSFAPAQIINAPTAANTAPSAKLTKELLIQIRAQFRKTQCDDEEIFITYNSSMLSAILADPDLTSADYMTVQMLQQGAVANKFLGFTWLPLEKITAIQDANAKTVGYTGAAWVKSGIHFGTGKDYSTDIGTRYDMSNIKQLSAQMSFGAGRSNEEKVVQFSFAV